MMAKTVGTEFPAYRPKLGDFTVGPSNKLKLTECPICVDPDRERTEFTTTDKPQFHFLHEHDADDVGRTMDELLEEMDFEARAEDQERFAIDEALSLAREHVRENLTPSHERRPYLYHFDRFLTELLSSPKADRERGEPRA